MPYVQSSYQIFSVCISLWFKYYDKAFYMKYFHFLKSYKNLVFFIQTLSILCRIPTTSLLYLSATLLHVSGTVGPKTFFFKYKDVIFQCDFCGLDYHKSYGEFPLRNPSNVKNCGCQLIPLLRTRYFKY